jgi:hypothetical protein
MDEKTKEGYVTGIGCLFLFSVFAYFAVMSASNMPAAALMGIFAALFGGLGFGSLAKPVTIGAVAAEFLKNLGKSSEEGSTDSHNIQIQKKSDGSVQVMTGDRAEVNINVPSGEKKQAEKPSAEEKEILRKETIVVSPSGGYYYEFEFMKGEYLKGEISSTSPIDIYFVDEFSFDKWNRDKSFDSEDSNEGILETNIDYLVPTKGTWYLIVENNGRKTATVKVQLY